MMSSETTKEQRIFEKSLGQRGGSCSVFQPPNSNMGVASPSAKRRLGNPDGDLDIVAAKLAKITKNHNNNNNNEFHHPLPPSSTPEDSIAVTTDFLTTSILARTLLTSSSGNNQVLQHQHLHHHIGPDPLESLKSTLDALPPPNQSLLSPFLKTTISDSDNDEFTSLLCHEPSLTPVAVINGLTPINSSADWSSSLNDEHEVITEEENGKSYFNLGSADATIVARKSSSSPNSMWINGNCANSNLDIDDNASSSSCESLSSSEDLFNSGEEFDASDDEDEEEFSSYKQQRSTVLHLSLCKLNKFRSQHCVEPSLHRSVLICNTLRHIEQEIKSEDEVDESLKSRERLPSFWRPTSNHHPHCFSSSPPPLPPNQPLPTDSRPSVSLPAPTDPYLSPNPYSTSNNPLSTARDSIPSLSLPGNGGGVGVPGTSQAQYLYDYCLRPTPYHTTSYDYEQDLPSLETTPNGSTSLDCDSGYGEELSYYYSTPPPPPPPIPPSISQQSSPNSSLPQQQLQQPLQVPISVDHTNTSNVSSISQTSSPQQFLGTDASGQSTTENKSEFESETDSDSSSGSSPPPGDGRGSSLVESQPDSSSSPPSFGQQDSQCGIESRKSTHLNFSSHAMPIIDTLISSSYVSSL